MGDDNSHASSVADLLRTAEEDEDVPEDLKERAKERREELEEGLEDAMEASAADHLRTAIDSQRDVQTDLKRAIDATEHEVVQEVVEDLHEETSDLIDSLGELAAVDAARDSLDEDDDVATDGGIVRDYDSPHEKLRQEFEILLGQNNTVLREMPAYTVGQLFQLVDAARRKYDVGIEEVREEEDGVRLLMLTGGEVSDEIAAAVGIDHPDQVDDLDVHMIDDRKMGGGG